MPSKRRGDKKRASDPQSTQVETLRWTDDMVQAALDEALQQDQLGKRAGQGFKDEALIPITAAAQAAMDPELGITLTVSQLEGKLAIVCNLFPMIASYRIYSNFEPLLLVEREVEEIRGALKENIGLWVGCRKRGGDCTGSSLESTIRRS